MVFYLSLYLHAIIFVINLVADSFSTGHVEGNYLPYYKFWEKKW